jgi:hypothetical protein
MNLYFGTREDWSCWNNLEVGRRLLSFLNAKMEGSIGGIASHLSRNKLNSSTTDLKFSSTHQQSSSQTLESSRKCASREIMPSASKEELSIENTQLPTRRKSLLIDTTIFFNYSEPPISLGDYIDRLIKYTKNTISPVNLGVALLYVDRIESKHVEVNRFSIFRLFAIAYLIAHKYTDDAPSMKNLEYSKIAGISLHELNSLEINFLKVIDFQLGIIIYVCIYLYIYLYIYIFICIYI